MIQEEIQRIVNALRSHGYRTTEEINEITNLEIIAVAIIIILIILL